jgi:hypothetical protein
MSAENIANEIATRQGWSDDTLLDLCLGYINRQGDNDAFSDYLTSIAEEENSSTGDEYDEATEEENDARYDDLHTAADLYASRVNNAGREAQRAFLLASGASEQDITDGADGEGEDALDMLVITMASQTASRAYNNDGAPEGVLATLTTVYDPDAHTGTVFEDESHG